MRWIGARRAQPPRRGSEARAWALSLCISLSLSPTELNFLQGGRGESVFSLFVCVGVDGVWQWLFISFGRVFVHLGWLLAFVRFFCLLLENGIIGFGHHGKATLGAPSMTVMLSEVYGRKEN